jgi:hypothetical protein
MSPHIHDILIDAVPGSAWIKAIDIDGPTGAKIERFDIDCGNREPPDTPITYSTHGIHLRHGATASFISAGVIQGTANGIALSDQYTEGTYIRGVEVSVADVGYLLESPGPGSAITDCHAATKLYGIKIVDHGDMALMGNLLYGQTSGWAGIDATGTGIDPNTGAPNSPWVGAHYLRIIGNQIASQAQGTFTGIRLSGYARDGVIQGNVLRDMTTGVELNGPNVTNNVVTGNRMSNVGTGLAGTAVPSNWTTPNY